MKFSVIIPVCNVAPYLRTCLESVSAAAKALGKAGVENGRTEAGASLAGCGKMPHLRGDEPRVEVICVDDGSTDGSGAILDEFGMRSEELGIKDQSAIRHSPFAIPDLVVLHQSNAGVSAARNAGIAAATGEYVCFLDGDDAILPDWFARAHETIAATDCDILSMGFQEWDGRAVQPRDDAPAETQSDDEASLRRWGWRSFTSSTPGGVWTQFIRRSLLVENRVQFPVGMRMKEDRIFSLCCLPFAKSVSRCDYRGYLYRVRETSVCHRQWASGYCHRYLGELARCLRTQADDLRRLGLYDETLKLFARAVECDLDELCEHGRVGEWAHDADIPALLGDFVRQGLLRVSDLRRKWRIPIVLAIRSRSLSVVAAYWLAIRCHRMIGLGAVVKFLRKKAPAQIPCAQTALHGNSVP